MILSELQALRADFNDNSRATGERLASLENSMHFLCGNGQPGKIADIEGDVKKLQQWRWYVVGISVGAGAVIPFLFHLVGFIQ